MPYTERATLDYRNVVNCPNFIAIIKYYTTREYNTREIYRQYLQMNIGPRCHHCTT